ELEVSAIAVAEEKEHEIVLLRFHRDGERRVELPPALDVMPGGLEWSAFGDPPLDSVELAALAESDEWLDLQGVVRRRLQLYRWPGRQARIDPSTLRSAAFRFLVMVRHEGSEPAQDGQCPSRSAHDPIFYRACPMTMSRSRATSCMRRFGPD